MPTIRHYSQPKWYVTIDLHFFFYSMITLIIVFFEMLALVECGFKIWKFNIESILYALFKVELKVVALKR